jgi:hypothetical protein
VVEAEKRLAGLGKQFSLADDIGRFSHSRPPNVSLQMANQYIPDLDKVAADQSMSNAGIEMRSSLVPHKGVDETCFVAVSAMQKDSN